MILSVGYIAACVIWCDDAFVDGFIGGSKSAEEEERTESDGAVRLSGVMMRLSMVLLGAARALKKRQERAMV